MRKVLFIFAIVLLVIAVVALVRSMWVASQIQAAPVFPIRQNVNGIKVDVASAEQTENSYKVNVCYSLPNQDESYAVDIVTLSTADADISAFQGVFVGDPQKDQDQKSIRRCEQLTFAISPTNDLSKVTLRIHRIHNVNGPWVFILK